MHDRPAARTDGLVTEAVEDELVVYDERTQTAHGLSREAAAVWSRCDGRRSSVEIGEEVGVGAEVVDRVLDELRSKDLLEEAIVVRSGYSRREAALKFAKVGGAAFVAPFVYSVSVASAATACVCSHTGTTQNYCPVPNTSNCATNNTSGAVACDCDCQSSMCYEGTANDRWCVPAGCLPGGTVLPSTTPCTACCAQVCAGSSHTCASSNPTSTCPT